MAVLEKDRKKTSPRPLSGVPFGLRGALLGSPGAPLRVFWSFGRLLGSLWALLARPGASFWWVRFRERALGGSRVAPGSVLGGFGVPPGVVLGGFLGGAPEKNRGSSAFRICEFQIQTAGRVEKKTKTVPKP